MAVEAVDNTAAAEDNHIAEVPVCWCIDLYKVLAAAYLAVVRVIKPVVV